ncbi:MAG: hypothetical protein FRX49_07281 [Trebouxia sp. A1-2]|nr:MAG: hypothetical protein FRX49_07281 [Trebouxia sp. A1-2]
MRGEGSRGNRLEERKAGGEKGKRVEGHDGRKAQGKKGTRGCSTSSSTATSPCASNWTSARFKHVKKGVRVAEKDKQAGSVAWSCKAVS